MTGIDPNWLAALSALGGALIGVAGAIFARGRTDGVIVTKIDAMSDKVDILTDELKRRVQVLEDRYFTHGRRQPAE